MASEEKTFFTYNGWLFCNTLFAPADVSPEVKWTDMEHDITKSCYKISEFVGCNAAEVKGTCTARFKRDAAGFNLQIPFKVMAEIISTDYHAIYDDEEMYNKVIGSVKK